MLLSHQPSQSFNRQSPILSPALAAQDYDNQAVSGDAQNEDKGINDRQEDLLKLSSHHMLHTTGLLQILSKVPRARARARACVIEVHSEKLETDDK